MTSAWNNTGTCWSLLVLWISVQLTSGGRSKDRRQRNRLAGPKAYMCYTCSSGNSAGCGVEFNLTKEEATRCIEGAVCYSLRHTINGVYRRGCSSESPPQLLRCYDEQIDDQPHQRCYCKGHYCNSATKPSLHPMLTQLLSILISIPLILLVTDFSSKGAS